MSRASSRVTAAALLVCVLMPCGCGPVDTMRRGWEHSQAVATALESSLGTKPSVGFSWQNGVLSSVSVTFEGMPKERTLEEITAVSQKAVLHEFQQSPKRIVLSFAIEP